MTDATEELYQKMWKYITSLTLEQGNSGLEIAAVMSAQAMTIYKTILPEDEYEQMMLAIYNSRQVVRKIELPDVTIQ